MRLGSSDFRLKVDESRSRMLLELSLPRTNPDTVRRRRVAIVVPILNERDNIERLVAALDRVLVGIDAEILFVDDWSQDGSAEIVTRLARRRSDIRLIRRFGRRGLASAVIEGMLATTADVVAVMDGDLQHDEAILPAMIDAVARGESDVAIASRYRAGGSCGDWAQDRAAISRFATRLTHAVIGCAVSDPLSGFFAIRRDLAVSLVPRLSGGGFKILLDLLACAPQPLVVREFAYRFRSRTAGVSKLGGGVAIDFLRLLARQGARRLFARRGPAIAATALLVSMLAVAILARSESGHGVQWQTPAAALGIMGGAAVLVSAASRRMRRRTRPRTGLA